MQSEDVFRERIFWKIGTDGGRFCKVRTFCLVLLLQRVFQEFRRGFRAEDIIPLRVPTRTDLQMCVCVCTVGIVGVHVRAGDVPPLDGRVDSSTETLLTAGGHRQRQHWTTGGGRGERDLSKLHAFNNPEFILMY